MSEPAGAPLYKGEPLDADRGPGLGCFWTQVVVLVILMVLTPIGVANAWPEWLTTVMLFATLILLLLAGQTVIFLLRLVAADRRTRRRPMRATTPTVGQLEDSSTDGPATGTGEADPTGAIPAGDSGDAVPSGGDLGPGAAASGGDTGDATGDAVPPGGDSGPGWPADEDGGQGHAASGDGSTGQPDTVRGPDQPPSPGVRQ